MAVTSIWPIRGRVGKVIDYARNPEKVTEGSLQSQADLHTIEGVMEYAADDMKTEQRSYVTCLNCREETAAKQFQETKEYWSRVKGIDKTGGRVCYHGYQSFAAGEVTAEIAHQIGVELAQRLWGEQFEVLVATHCNTGHYHNHYVMNSVSWRDGHKFHNGPDDYQLMRDTSDRLCLKYGLSIIEEPEGKGKTRGEYTAEQNGKPTVRGLIRQDIEEAIAASVTSEEFFSRLTEKGYDIKLRTDSGSKLRYPALRPPSSGRFFRFHNLGPGYYLSDILRRVSDNYRRKLPFPEEEQEKVRRYREKTQPREKPNGLRALYIRYCYELHIIEKHPASVKRVSFFMRQDLTRMELLDEQTRLLAEHRIETKEDLDSYRKGATEEIESLTELRKDLRNELKRVQRKGDSEAVADVKARIGTATEAIKKKKHELYLCDCIEARSAPMERELDALIRDQNEGKEEIDNEQHLGRSGRTGRPDVLGRG